MSIACYDSISAIKSLREEIQKNHLSQCMLFLGQSYTGKRTTAYWLAQTLLKISPLPASSPFIVSLGSLPRWEEWETFKTIRKEKLLSLPTLKNFLSSILLKVSSLQERDEKKTTYSRTDLEKIQEFINSKENQEQEIDLKELQSIESSLKKIFESYSSSISVNQIRSLKEWSLQLKGQTKVVIIEGSQNLSSNSSNALLKITEEPPNDFFIILTETNRNNIPSTLLSRLRPYIFSDYSKEQVGNIIRCYGQISSEFLSLKDFFSSYSLSIYQQIEKLSYDFFYEIEENETFPYHLNLDNFLKTHINKPHEVIEIFVKSLSHLWQTRIYENPSNYPVFEKLHVITQKRYRESSAVNQNGINFLEGLYYDLRKVMKNFKE